MLLDEQRFLFCNTTNNETHRQALYLTHSPPFCRHGRGVCYRPTDLSSPDLLQHTIVAEIIVRQTRISIWHLIELQTYHWLTPLYHSVLFHALSPFVCYQL